MFSIFKEFTNFLWTYPVLFVLVGGGILMTITLNFFQFTHFKFILKQTFGKMFKKGKGDGTITPFQAATSALASTIGAANIIGVPLAIMTGGPGAVFWMWIIALFGCALKYSEIILGIKYREKNNKGEFVGGPMYYLKKGVKSPFLASLFAFFLMIEIAPSIATQSASVIQSASTINIPKFVSGAILVILTAIIVYGGIKRIAQITEKMVPFMAIIYIVMSLVVIIYNYQNIIPTFILIFKGAFTNTAATGGFLGSTVAMTIKAGASRGAYSNEAGMGTATIAHSAAITDHPARQALWGVFEVIVDTLIICTLSGLLVLTTGVWEKLDMSKAASMPALAIQSVWGEKFGGIVITICMLLFVFSTIIVIIFYGEKQAEYLFGNKFSKVIRVVYLLCIVCGAAFNLENVVVILDFTLACVIVTNMIGVIKLRGEVKEISNSFFKDKELMNK